MTLCGCLKPSIYLFIWGFTLLSTHCTGHIMTGSFMGRGNQYIQFIRVLYRKLATNGKQLPAFPLEVGPGIELRSQKWEASVLPLCHRGPSRNLLIGSQKWCDCVLIHLSGSRKCSELFSNCPNGLRTVRTSVRLL